MLMGVRGQGESENAILCVPLYHPSDVLGCPPPDKLIQTVPAGDNGRGAVVLVFGKRWESEPSESISLRLQFLCIISGNENETTGRRDLE